MKSLLLLGSLLVGTQAFAAGPVCSLHITNNEGRTYSRIVLKTFVAEGADIPGHQYNKSNGSYELHIFNCDGNYNATITADGMTREISVSDEGFTLELQTSVSTYSLTCPKFIF